MALHIIVCAKQVPDTNEIRIDQKTGTLIRDGVPSILNHDDANALEEALRIKDRYPDTKVTVITMGPPQAYDLLQECLSMGADEGVLITDRAVSGSDTWATSNAISAGIRKIGDYDLIFAGRQAIDGDTAQVGPQIAERLGLPQVTYVQKFELLEDGKTVRVERALEDGFEIIEMQLPCMITAIKELNVPRHMHIADIMAACEKPVYTWSAADIGVDLNTVGLEASPTNVYRSFTPKPREKGILFEGEPDQVACDLLAALKEKHVI